MSPRVGISTAVLIALLACPTVSFAKKQNPPKPVSIADVVSKVSNSLAKACQKSDPNAANPCGALAGVDITLHTEVNKDGSVGVSIFGISISAHREKDSYNEFSLHLAPPGATPPSMTASQTADVSEQLVSALKAFSDASVAAQKGDYPLTAKGFYLELSFTVQYGGSIDTSGLTLIPIYPDVSGKIDKKFVQTIRLTFGKTS